MMVPDLVSFIHKGSVRKTEHTAEHSIAHVGKSLETPSTTSCFLESEEGKVSRWPAFDDTDHVDVQYYC
jgi:hypothetical protein